MAKVMICDDAAFMRMMIKDILQRMVMRLQRRLKMVLLQWKNILKQNRIWY